MDVCAYEVILQFNQGLDRALAPLDIFEKLALESPICMTKIRSNLSELRSYADDHFAAKIAQQEREEENNFYRARPNREGRARPQRNLLRIEIPRAASARTGFAAAGRDSTLVRGRRRLHLGHAKGRVLLAPDTTGTASDHR
jgi:hypothetical protein